MSRHTLHRAPERSTRPESTWRYRATRLVGSGLLLAAALNGCTDDDSPSSLPKKDTTPSTETTAATTTSTPTAPDTLTCAKVPGVAWRSVPVNINIEAIAEALGTAPENVANGSMGQVTCEQPVQFAGQKARVEGFLLECQLIAVMSDEPPKADELYDTFGAVCPDPDAVTS